MLKVLALLIVLNLIHWIKKIYLSGYIIFSNLVIFFRKDKTRLKLRRFLEKEYTNYNVDILVEIIPNYLVELLEIYIFLSSRIQIKELHSWVMDIYLSPLLVVSCFRDRKILKVGYQHGGGYGFVKNFNYHYDFENKFYDKFIFWGFKKKDIYINEKNNDASQNHHLNL